MSLSSDVLIFTDSVIYNSTGLLFVVLGVFTSIRMSGFPDLTVDGSFTIGAALYSVLLASGWGTPLALSAAAAGGALGGLLTWTINDRLGVGKVVSSVLSMIILILSAPYVSGGSTKGLLNVVSIFSKIDAHDASLSHALLGEQPYQMHLLLSLILLAGFFLIGWAFIIALRSRTGLRLRYIGSAASPTLTPRNEQRRLLLLGLLAGNAIVAIGGSIEAQRRGGYTNNMGIGILLVALAVLILGEALIKSVRKRDYLRLSEYATAVIVGTIVYSAGVQGLLALRIDFVDLRLLTALFLLLLLGIAGRAYSSSTKLF
jgi:putative tryptophan/tyrosine transport system permease protein